MQIYNKEYNNKRNLPTIDVTSKDDIVINDNPVFSISLLKDFISKQEILLTDEDEEELISDNTDKLIVSNIVDEGDNKISVTYTYKYEIEEESFEDNVEIQIEMGLTSNNKLVVRFDRIDGNLLYYKKILTEIRNKCYAL